MRTLPVVALCLALPALALAAPSRGAARAQARAELSPAQAARFMEQVARREAGFHRPGVGYDATTGLTFDGHPIDPRTGELAGGPRNWSAASKESLHISLLVKALQGDRTAQLIVSPDGDRAHAAPLALDLLQRKIDTYAAFNRAHPGYGGFLPWYRIEAGKVEPTPDWQDRVPGLDNGQLAWSVYHAARALKDLGQADLAARYASHLELMKQNVVRLFYDPQAKKMRAETHLSAGNAVPVGKQRYTNNQKDYFLDDPYEGLLLCHFADLFGNWSKHPAGREAIWKTPRRVPATFKTRQGERLTVVRGHWFSAHEEWAFLVLPFRDLPVARDLFANAQKVRTIDARQRRLRGLKASTHRPREDGRPPSYASALGVQAVAKQRVTHANILAPYAAFPLALVDRQAFASWLKPMLITPKMWGPNGMGESFRARSGKIAPLLTWDGKMLPMMAWMGGISDDLRGYLRRDGVYGGFLGRVEHDYSAFAGKPIEGRAVGFAAPPASKKGHLSASKKGHLSALAGSL